MSRRRIIPALASGFLLLAGCTSSTTDPGPVFEQVAGNVRQRSGDEITWPRDPNERAAVNARVAEMLENELTLQESVLTALLNNRRLRATYERLGIAQANLVQAQLIKNPVFDLSLRYVEGHGDDYILEMGLIQDVLDVFLIPLRKRLSKAELEVAKSQVIGAVLDTAVRVEKAYISLQSAEHTLQLNRQILASTEASYDAARRLHKAGNITDLALANERSLYEQSKLAVASAETDVLEMREQMNALMGLWGRDTDWEIARKLRPLPEENFDLGNAKQ